MLKGVATFLVLVGAATAFRLHHPPKPAQPVAAGVPVLAPWPNAFSVPFNATVLEFGIIGAASYLYYDWSLTSQRIDFSLCAANAVLAPCSVIFNGTGAYLLQGGKCCQTAPVGCLPPDWTSNLIYNLTTSAYGTEVYLFKGGQPVHDYYNGVASNSPVFLQVEDVNECWNFLETWTVAPQDPELFVLPDNCSNSC